MSSVSMSPDPGIAVETCTIKLLPQDQWIPSASRAIAINPANAPAVHILRQALPDAVIPPEHLALLTAKYWGKAGVQLTVGFLDNPPADLRARILSHMNAWNRTANVQFVETASSAQVRIARTQGGGYWSYLGTDILSIGANQPTMNLDSFTMNTADSEFYRVVRHETGHTLGFPHEHTRSQIVNRIDREKAISYFMATQGWSRDQVIAQVLTPLDNSALIATADADPQSIMCYWLPASIMNDGVAVTGGTDIDATDAQFAASVYPRTGWQRFELAPGGSASTTSKVAAVSRIPGSMETWWIGADGSVQGAFWYDGGQWQRYQLAPAGSASTSGGITAVSRIPGSMEVWWIGANGSVQDAFWYDGGQWQRFELAPAGSASTSGGMRAVSRVSNSMELWWIGANGSVQDAFWYEGGQWQRFELAPAGSASTSSGIGAVSRVPNSMELWWIGANGSVQDAFWYDGGQWQRFELAPAGSASTSSGVRAVSRVPNSMELWWIGANGSVQDAFWYEGGQWQRFELASAGSASTSSGVRAVSRIPNSMELWWIGGNGSVQDAFWYEGGQWQRFELAPAGSASLGSGIGAVSRIPGSMEVWWIGANGSVQDAFWYG